MVAGSDFSGLTRSVWAFARAPAMAPMVSLERCMTSLKILEIETDGARLGAPCPHTMPDGFLGVLWHQFLELSFRSVVFEIGRAGLAKYAGEFRPGIR